MSLFLPHHVWDFLLGIHRQLLCHGCGPLDLIESILAPSPFYLAPPNTPLCCELPVSLPTSQGCLCIMQMTEKTQ